MFLPNRIISTEGKPYRFFSGTSYLGMSANATFQAMIQQGFERYGTAFGVSRNGNFQLNIYEEAESYLANWLGVEATLTTSSGMLAGLAVINLLKTQAYQFLYAPHTHPALWHEAQPDIPKTTFSEWVQETDFSAISPRTAILCNSIEALRVSEQYSFDWIDELPENQEIVVVIDDSHGIGILGEHGRGITSILQNKKVEIIVVASMHKALGIPAGVIAGEQKRLADLRQSVFFSACSPANPAFLWAFLKAENIYDQARQKLKGNIRYFTQEIENLKLFQSLPDFPVFYTPHTNLYPFLLEQGIFIYQFAYPIQTATPNTRIVLSAWHEQEDLEKLIETLDTFE